MKFFVAVAFFALLAAATAGIIPSAPLVAHSAYAAPGVVAASPFVSGASPYVAHGAPIAYAGNPYAHAAPLAYGAAPHGLYY